jgi:hypothetical protein
MATEEEIIELRRWVEDLFANVRQLRIDQHIWDEVQTIIASNPNLHRPSHFYQWMQDMFVSGIAMGIRRQLDDDTRTRSFYRFLKRIKGDPSLVSRKRYRGLYKDGDPTVEQLKRYGLLERTVNDTYDRLVGAGKPQPSAEDIQEEIEALQRVSTKFVAFANQVIAHDDRTKPTELPRFLDVDRAITALEQLVQRYAQLFEAAHRSVDLNFQYDWRAIFRVPWIP